MELAVGPLSEAEWPLARALLHRAFVGEAWTAAIYGEPLAERWAASWDLYSSLGPDDYSVSVAGHLGGVLVGVVLGSVAGRCRHCQVLAGQPRPPDDHLAIEWEFQQNVGEVHATLGQHAWIEKVAVEPALHGLGLGRWLVASAEGTYELDPPVEVVLECAPDRLSFYTAMGYDVVSTVTDPAGPDAYVLHRWLRRPG